MRVNFDSKIILDYNACSKTFQINHYLIKCSNKLLQIKKVHEI